MSGKLVRFLPVVTVLAVAAGWYAPLHISGQQVQSLQQIAGQYPAQPSTTSGEWPMYTADLSGSKYSPLDQINATNFSKLEVAWRFKTDNLGPRPENKLEGTPMMVKGTVYTTGGTRRAVVALDGRTGELKWVYSLDEGERATRWAPRQLSGRGVSYWTDGKGDERIFYVTIGYRLVALNAKTGQPVQSFGQNGILDLKEGVVIGKDKQIDLESGEIGLHSTPTVVGDVIIVGSSMFEGLGYLYSTNAKGLVRAFDIRTGKQIWRFNTIPMPGEFGNDTWENGSWEWSGNTGVWTQITVDPEAGLVYLPVETPTIDEYGGNRPGDNLFAESLVAVDLKTGVRKWHFQLVHHPLWDHDISSAPLLIDANIDGKPRKLVAQPTKQGWLYTFDRITGQPIWPIPEVPVPQTDMGGEKTATTQPIPTKPPPYSRTFVSKNDLIDFTPALRAQALENLKRFRWEETPFVPPVGPNSQLLGAINIGNTGGGVNWPGSGFDPETATFYTQASNAGVTAAKYDEEEFQRVRPETQAKLSPNGRIPRWEAEPNYGLGRGRGAARRTRRACRTRRRTGPRRSTSRGSRRGAAAGAAGGSADWSRRADSGPRRAVDREAAVRRDQRDRSEHRNAEVPGAARRHAGRGAQPPDPQGPEHPEDRPARQRRHHGHQDAGRRGRSAGHRTAGTCARRDAARVQQADRRAGRRGADAGADQRPADDLPHRRPAVHHRRRQRRELHGRVHRLRAAGVGDSAERRELGGIQKS